MPTLTSRWNLRKPKVGDPEEEDLWGDELNDDMDIIDEALEVVRTQTVAASGSTSLNVATAPWIVLTHGVNITTFGLTNWTSTPGRAEVIYIRRVKDNSATARTIAWPTITWVNGDVEPSLTQTANAVDHIWLWSDDGGTTIYGNFAPA